MRHRVLTAVLSLFFSVGCCLPALAAEKQYENLTDLGLTSKSALLMEEDTGTILYEQNSHEALPPASVTKVMTLLLIYEGERDGKFDWTDTVQVSEHAASMGGSQVFLEEGETQTAADMTKSIAIASANDAAVAMAEFLAGSEEAFVQKMNERAKELGMEDTNFVNACGLDTEGHVSSAYDIALMSRELMENFPEIKEYTTTWQDSIVHKTRRGEETFGLTNTNKLIRSYDGCVGLKTGSTSVAKYCVSAVAQRNGITLISVVMTAPDYKVRFSDAAAMLNLGFGCCKLYVDSSPEKLPKISLKGGVADQTACEYAEEFRYLDTTGASLENIEKKIVLPDSVQAPVVKGDKAGTAEYYLDGKKIGSVDLLFSQNCQEAGYIDCLKKIWDIFL